MQRRRRRGKEGGPGDSSQSQKAILYTGSLLDDDQFLEYDRDLIFKYINIKDQ
jgi:hypothetical protein